MRDNIPREQRFCRHYCFSMLGMKIISSLTSLHSISSVSIMPIRSRSNRLFV